jgi:hypothetical protein
MPDARAQMIFVAKQVQVGGRAHHQTHAILS